MACFKLELAALEPPSYSSYFHLHIEYSEWTQCCFSHSVLCAWERVFLKLRAQEGTEIIPGIVNAIKTNTYDILLGRELHTMDQCLWEASPPGNIKKGRKKKDFLDGMNSVQQPVMELNT